MSQPPVPPAAWSELATSVGHNLQKIRVSRGLTQDQVAYRAGLSRYTYQKYEAGESRPGQPANPSIRSLLAIAQVLEVEIGALIPRDGPDLTAR